MFLNSCIKLFWKRSETEVLGRDKKEPAFLAGAVQA
jgi:hypothetical protein